MPLTLIIEIGMVVFPNAKINLGLNIVSKRPDGYHNIETLFYPIGLSDVLEVVPAANPAAGTQLHLSGIVVDGAAGDNLVMKACRLLSDRFELPEVDICLDKIIPFGAGLGGGSSDAAFMLRLLRDMYGLPVTDDELCRLAAGIGADCPFFLLNRPVMARGIGNEFETVDFSLSGKYLVLVKPPVKVSTPEAYSLVKPQVPEMSIPEILNRPLAEWRFLLKNDFEKSVFARYPRIEEIKALLYERGAAYASMSGSGSSVFGLFEAPADLDGAFEDCFVWQGDCLY